MKHLCLFLVLLVGSLWACKESGPAFSPGAADPRIVGTWQLVERRFQRDSSYSIVNITPRQDSGGRTRYDTLFIRRDTSFYTTRRFPAIPPQTLTFNSDGTLSRRGDTMSYFAPIRFFRVDSLADPLTGIASLGVSFFVTTNRANVAFRQNVAFRRDTLVLLPRCDQPCWMKLLRTR